MTSQPKVLIFDSGVGGLSVYKAIIARLPQLSIVYTFDNEAYPYGELEQKTLLSRVLGIVQRAVLKDDIDLVVIACNTASTIVLPALRAKLQIPVVGVVPAIKPASLLSHLAVGLIATPATVTRPYTQELIQHFSPHKPVELLGSTRLVDMAEEKLRGHGIDLHELEHILAPLHNKIDVAVLGCTHFPLIKEEIQTVLGNQVRLVDSGEAIARRVAQLLSLPMDEEDRGQREKHRIMSSTTPWEETALNMELNKLGFGIIQNCPYPMDA
ncbi:glutamate racemase [Vibrio zhugei]|uniref:Glutamate racemase n=1 Tax=Vibrio zhugei TaxID=2479546 RepID=A0ABV7CA28_9VIBR|nr:glutamate racemase [Vibrio zhugei]